MFIKIFLHLLYEEVVAGKLLPLPCLGQLLEHSGWGQQFCKQKDYCQVALWQ
jgi:hypothetical protein